MPKVSIIMGTYNCEETIENCINSILNQTFKDWEYIICDDGSTDQTYEILLKFAKKDQRIRIIKNKTNMRLAATLNNCLKYAKGLYIARMDADDESMPNRLEKQVEFLDHHKKYACVGTNVIIYDGKEETGIREIIEKPDKYILLQRTPFAHPTIMMRRTVYEILNGYTVSKKTMRAEDLDLWFRFFAHGFEGYNLQEGLYRYHESREDYKKRNLKAAIQTTKVYIEGYRQLKFKKRYYVMALKPIISALIPNKIMEKYHIRQLKKGEVYADNNNS